MSNLYKADVLVYKVIDHLVANYFPDLAYVHEEGHKSEILVLIREKAAKSKGRILLGRTRKPPAELKVVGEHFQFIVELSGEHWGSLTSKQQEALMFRCLCSLKVEEDEKTQEMKYSIVDPEVSYYHKELDRYGDWMPRFDEEDDENPEVTGTSRDPEKLEEIFGVTDPVSTGPEED
jgi:hypothetical protein